MNAARIFAGALALSLTTSLASASESSRARCEHDLAPRIGEAGKDVIWVPTPDALVAAMLKAAKTTSQDYIIDLGSGDGKIPIAAAKQFGAHALGIEYNPQMVKLAQCYVRAEGVTGRVEIRHADIFQTDFSKATVLTLYLLSDLNMKLRPTILQMKPGTRVVSNTFKMGDWDPDEFVDSELGNTRGYLWIVPAQVEGTWTFKETGGDDSFRLQLEQRHQEIKGHLLGSARDTSVRAAKLRGTEVEFILVRTERPLALKGTIEDDKIRASALTRGRMVEYVGTRS
ncbi:MAG: class I SAM-dependent methyltransferase [Steroidobacteraceae bacterium]